MSIEDIRITNAELASAMARGAVKQTELEMANIDRRVREMQATTLSRANCIEAEGQARAIDIMAKVSTRVHPIVQNKSIEVLPLLLSLLFLEAFRVGFGSILRCDHPNWACL